MADICQPNVSLTDEHPVDLDFRLRVDVVSLHDALEEGAGRLFRRLRGHGVSVALDDRRVRVVMDVAYPPVASEHYPSIWEQLKESL